MRYTLLLPALTFVVVHALLPVPYQDHVLAERQNNEGCNVPCGFWNNWYTQICCGDEQYCTTDNVQQAKCTSQATTVVTVSTAISVTQTATLTATAIRTPTERSRTTPTPTQTAPTSALPSNSTKTDLSERRDDWPQGKKIGVGVGAGIGAAIIVAGLIYLCISRRRQRRDATAQGGANLARVLERQRSLGEIARTREEAIEEVQPPRYENNEPNPFTREAMARSKSQGFRPESYSSIGGIMGGGDVNELPVARSEASERSDRSIPRRPLRGVDRSGMHQPSRGIPPPPAMRMNIRPDHDMYGR